MSLAGSRWSTMCAQSAGSVGSSVVSGSVSVSVVGNALVMTALCLASAVDRAVVVAGGQRALGAQVVPVPQRVAALTRRTIVGDDHRAPRQHHAADDERQ